MKKQILLLLLIGLCPAAIADGIAIDPYDYHLAEMGQESQIAYIDFDGEKSTVSLFVTFDFAGYGRDKMTWIVPFKDVPDSIDLEESTFYQFEQKFSEFDQGIENATKLKRAYESDAPTALTFVTGLYYIPFASFAAMLFVTTAAGAAREAIPEESFDFGSLGRADVYKISDEVTLQQFFQEKGVQPPPDLGGFLDKHIVVFSINKTGQKLSTLVTFEFSNRNELFYPSSTTGLWRGTPDDFIVKVRAPLQRRLSPNLKPNLEIDDLQYQYLLFSPSCTGMAQPEYFACLSKRPEFAHLQELYSTDLEIEVKEERKALPIGMYVTGIVPPIVLALLLILVSWIAATYAYSRLLKKKYLNKEILKIGVIGFFHWMVLNIIFSFLFAVLLIAVLFPLYLISFALGGYSAFALLMAFLPLIVLGDLAGVALIFKVTAVDRFDKLSIFPKGRVKFRDFAAILVGSLLINVLLVAVTLALFPIPV